MAKSKGLLFGSVGKIVYRGRWLWAIFASCVFVSYCSKRCATIPKEFVDPAVEDLIANPSGVDSNQFAETIRRFFLN